MSTVSFNLELTEAQVAAIITAIAGQKPAPKTPTAQKAQATPVNPTQGVRPQVYQSAPQQAVVTPTNGTTVVGTAPVKPVSQAPVATTVPTAPTHEYTIDELALAAQGLMDAGKMQELTTLLAQFKLQSMQQLPKEQYGAFATALRGLGGKI